MKKLLSLFIGLMLVLITTFGQSNVTITEKEKESGYKVDVIVSDRTISPADRASFENKLDNTNIGIQDIKASVDEMKAVLSTLAFNKTNANLAYLAAEYGLSKEDIKIAVARSKLNKLIASILPALLLIFLWIRMYNYKRIEGNTYAVLAVLSMLLAAMSYFIIYGALEFFNPNMATLRELSKLL